MNTKQQSLEAAVKQAQEALNAAQCALNDFLCSPENHRYESLDDAFELEWDLRDKAAEDCEGSYNCGDDEYRQEFYIGDDKYTAVLYDIEYNRHDKRYYFLDYAKFRIEGPDGTVHTA